jgi:MFS family permease
MQMALRCPYRVSRKPQLLGTRAAAAVGYSQVTLTKGPMTSSPFARNPEVAASAQSPWAPFAQPMFRAVWTANVISSVGGWMQAVAATWLMTTLTTSPQLVTMVQSAGSLPVVLLALPAGALADIANRRRILIISQLWMMAVAVILTALTFTGAITPGPLLAFTGAMALGTAMMGPAFQAVITELVPAAQLGSAVALNSAGFNLARAVGPAIAGIVLARASAGIAFAVNALSFLGVIIVLFRWRSTTRKSVLPAERFVRAMREGVRYVRYAPPLQTVLLRTGAFILFGSAIWALLPLVVIRQLNGGPSNYGVLLGSLGVGALSGTMFLPKLKKRFDLEFLVDCNIAVFAGTTIAASLMHSAGLLIVPLFAGGVAWISLLSLFNVSARGVVPTWIEARALAVYLLVFQGGTAVGSLLWGVVAGRIGVQRSLMCAGAGLLLNLLLAFRFSLSRVAAVDAAQTNHWPEPHLVEDVRATNAPTLVTVQYSVDPSRCEEFSASMHKLEISRRRDGALYWALFEDPLHPGGYLEEFLVESWLEHLRQHERGTADDWRLQESIRAMQTSSDLPRVAHYLADERVRRRERKR